MHIITTVCVCTITFEEKWEGECIKSQSIGTQQKALNHLPLIGASERS